MALITSDCDAMRVHEHQMALNTSACAPLGRKGGDRARPRAGVFFNSLIFSMLIYFSLIFSMLVSSTPVFSLLVLSLARHLHTGAAAGAGGGGCGRGRRAGPAGPSGGQVAGARAAAGGGGGPTYSCGPDGDVPHRSCKRPTRARLRCR